MYNDSCTKGFAKQFGECIELPEIVQKIRNGYNVNEITLIPKNIKNKGFFENFFQLFS